jgi:hypothetical protein
VSRNPRNGSMRPISMATVKQGSVQIEQRAGTGQVAPSGGSREDAHLTVVEEMPEAASDGCPGACAPAPRSATSIVSRCLRFPVRHG